MEKKLFVKYHKSHKSYCFVVETRIDPKKLWTFTTSADRFFMFLNFPITK